MQVAAKLRNAPMSAQKCRVVIEQVRNLPVGKALQKLAFSPKKSARFVKKLLDSAIANAEYNEGADVDDLFISSIYVDDGTQVKRIKPRAKGRANRIKKRRCHITIQVSNGEE